MKKHIFIFLLIFSGHAAFCQEVIINGTDKNRPLTWDDFTGKPDKGSPHDANTYWKLNYSYQGVTFKGDTAKLTGFQVKLELDKTLSWIKDGKETANLLKHEQGHFNIGLLCQKKIIKLFNNTVFFRSDFQNKVQTIFKTAFDEYTMIGRKYDEETDHSKNRESQEKWNDFFAKELINQ
jgi:Bacterial protein of unknown function (DUF922)